MLDVERDMLVEMIKSIYVDFVDNLDIKENPEMDSLRIAEDVYNKTLSSKLTPKEYLDIEELLSDVTYFTHMQGFVYGFMHAIRLHCQAKKEKGSENHEPEGV